MKIIENSEKMDEKSDEIGFEERKIFVDLPQDIYGVAIAVAIGDLPCILSLDKVTKAG